MKFSEFGKKFTSDAGILSLMDDLGKALASQSDVVMMGGGNPGYIPEVQDILRTQMISLLDNKAKFHELTGIYDPPQGHLRFTEACARLLRKEYGWDVGPENICLTNGSQSGFFILFNLFGGRYEDGTVKKIRLPLAPEYIGYSDLGITHDFFTATKPKIELLENRMFKYRIDFDQLEIGEETGAICVSRPTNPTGNVITDSEVERLLELCNAHHIPLILDNAYGVPFPGIIYTSATPMWDQNVIKCLSLSKFGLPAVRTGIIVAREEIIRAISSLNAIMALAPNSFGAMLTEGLFQSGEILEISTDIIKPFYQKKAQAALETIEHYLSKIPYRLHKVEGSMFLWLWFKDLPITSLELYERLKSRGVLVVSGHYFFPGLDSGWKHQHECIRLTYSQNDQDVERGIKIMAEELAEIYQNR
ncbi:MAG: valine--pyruvate transaminase [Desulfobulbaceae bacterium]|nr:MAG: valine--pyruvate transaminase [Desulfobulbaceae bacterium]